MKLPKLLQFRRRMCDNYLHRIYHPHMWKLLLLFWLDLIVRFNLMFSLKLLRFTLFLEKIFSDAVPPCTSHSDWTIQRMNSFFPPIKTSHVSRYGIAFIEQFKWTNPVIILLNSIVFFLYEIWIKPLIREHNVVANAQNAFIKNKWPLIFDWDFS